MGGGQEAHGEEDRKHMGRRTGSTWGGGQEAHGEDSEEDRKYMGRTRRRTGSTWGGLGGVQEVHGEDSEEDRKYMGRKTGRGKNKCSIYSGFSWLAKVRYTTQHCPVHNTGLHNAV